MEIKDKLSGILVVNKPPQMTSHDVVNVLRKVFQTKVVGHFGTLDPDATGVLVVGIGKMTKLAPFLENDSKSYIAEFVLGYSTTTDDLSGEKIHNSEVDLKEISEKEIDHQLSSIIGSSLQRPPLYSAVKVDGRKGYEYARKNIDVVLEPRQIEIHSCERISPITYNETIRFTAALDVSKGTYIRALVRDFGMTLRTFGCMGQLQRTRSGTFTLDDAYTLEQIKAGELKFQSLKRVFANMKIVDIQLLESTKRDYCETRIQNGMKISLGVLPEKHRDIAFFSGDDFRGIYTFEKSDTHEYYKAVRICK